MSGNVEYGNTGRENAGQRNAGHGNAGRVNSGHLNAAHMEGGTANAERESQAALLAGLNASLHTMSQPLTALLCMLEYGAGLEGPQEVKEILAGGLEQCERLIGSVRAMQMQVLRAAEG